MYLYMKVYKKIIFKRIKTIRNQIFEYEDRYGGQKYCPQIPSIFSLERCALLFEENFVAQCNLP